MLDNLKNLIQEIRQKESTENTLEKSFQNHKYFYAKFEKMFLDWTRETKKGNNELVHEINKILEEEIKTREFNGERPRPKKRNSLSMLTFYKGKLKHLYYEIDKSKISNDSSNCNCALRQKYNLNPEDVKLLNEYGRVYYIHVDDDYILYECKECSAKWINAYCSEIKLSKNWMIWNPKFFPLLEQFT